MGNGLVINIIINAVISMFGVYLIGITLQMKKSKKLNKTVIAVEDINKCKDVQGYIDFVSPKMIIFGIVIIVVGLLGIAELFINTLYRFRFFTLIIFAITFAVYVHEMRVAKTKYMY